MKKNLLVVMVLAASCSFASSAFAGSGDVMDMVKKVKALNGRTGKVASSYENDSTGKCTIAVSEDEYGVSVSFEDTGFYFTPIAHITEEAEAESSNTLIVSTNSNRPGGDACGDSGGAINYKKTLTIKGREVRIAESFRCTFEGFKKYNLISTCTL